MSLLAIMDELADVIREALDNVTDVTVQVEPRMVLNPTPPTVDIYPADVARDAETAGFVDVDGAYLLTVRARVTTADNTAGQDLLLAFMDDTDDLSLAAAVVSEPTLNGWASSIHARDPSGYRLFEAPSGDGALLGFQFTAVVIPAES